MTHPCSKIVPLRPGLAPAKRLMSGNLASTEQRQIALDLLRESLGPDCTPNDLLWADSGTIEPGLAEKWRAPEPQLSIMASYRRWMLGALQSLSVAALGLACILSGVLMAVLLSHL